MTRTNFGLGQGLSGWIRPTLGSELLVGITTATTIINNPIILNHNLGRSSL